MSGMDDDVGDLAEDLLAENGAAAIYVRGAARHDVTLARLRQSSQLSRDDRGRTLRLTPADFIAETSDLPFDPPLAGDRIVFGGLTYELQPTDSEDCFRRVSTQMTRLLTRQIATP